MLLPLHILESIDYYKHDISINGEIDIITLYFKSRWRFPREIKHNRLTKISSENVVSLVPSQSTLELLEQLETFIGNKNRVMYFSRDQYMQLLNFTIKNASNTFESYDDFIAFLQKFSDPDSEKSDFPENVIPFKPRH